MSFYPWLDEPRWFGGLSWRGWLLIALLILSCSIGIGFPQAPVCYQPNYAEPEQCSVHQAVISGGIATLGFIELHHDLFIVLGTFVLAWYTARLWKDSGEAVRAAINSARAMESSVEETRINARHELRAYMAHEHFHSIPVSHDGKTIAAYRINARWKNVGRTPALNSVSWASFKFIGGPQPADPGFTMDALHPPPISAAIGPSIGMDGPAVDIPVERLIAAWDQRKAQTATIFLWTGTLYYDVYGEKRRTSQICVIVMPVEKPVTVIDAQFPIKPFAYNVRGPLSSAD